MRENETILLCLLLLHAHTTTRGCGCACVPTCLSSVFRFAFSAAHPVMHHLSIGVHGCCQREQSHAVRARGSRVRLRLRRGMVTQVQTVVSVREDTNMMSPLPLLAVENLNTPLASHHAIVTALPDARPPDVDPPVRRSSCVRARVAVVPLCEGATLLLCCCFWFASHSLLPISCVPSQSSFCQELITITHSSWPSGHELL